MQGGRETTASTRYLAALGFSLGCHAALLLALTLFPPVRIPLANERALVVAIIDDAGAGDASGGAGKADADTSGGARDRFFARQIVCSLVDVRESICARALQPVAGIGQFLDAPGQNVHASVSVFPRVDKAG